MFDKVPEKISVPPARPLWSRICGWLLALLLVLGSAPAAASVTITFYSKEFDSSFPHAFVLVRGVVDETAEKIDTNYGFTATHVSPAVLLGSVTGEIMTVSPEYVARSVPHIALTLTDAEYAEVMAVVEQWRGMKQPSYHLNKRNCVFFVADIAATLGMKVDTSRLMKKPYSFLSALAETNRQWLAARSPSGGILAGPAH